MKVEKFRDRGDLEVYTTKESDLEKRWSVWRGEVD